MLSLQDTLRHPQFRNGAREMSAVSLGIAAWGLVTGVAMVKGGLSIPLALLMLIVVAGVSPEAALVANLTATFCSLFQHANIRTPQWLGYFIQRPEAHSAHHERAVHAYNYSDLPLWDLVFGTFKNPATFEGANGFYDGASARIPEMLLGMDVSKPRAQLEEGVPASA